MLRCLTQMIIPQAVEQEILDGPDDDLAKHWIKTTGQQWVQDIGPVVPLVAAWDLGVGESAVLSWSYQHPEYQSVVDDLAARKFAKAFGIALCGTIGVIVGNGGVCAESVSWICSCRGSRLMNDIFPKHDPYE